MKKQNIKHGHGTRRVMRFKATALLKDHSGVTPWETMSLIRLFWDEELTA